MASELNWLKTAFCVVFEQDLIAIVLRCLRSSNLSRMSSLKHQQVINSPEEVQERLQNTYRKCGGCEEPMNGPPNSGDAFRVVGVSLIGSMLSPSMPEL